MAKNVVCSLYSKSLHRAPLAGRPFFPGAGGCLKFLYGVCARRERRAGIPGVAGLKGLPAKQKPSVFYELFLCAKARNIFEGCNFRLFGVLVLLGGVLFVYWGCFCAARAFLFFRALERNFYWGFSIRRHTTPKRKISALRGRAEG